MFSGLFKFNSWYAAVAGIGIILSAVYTLNMIKHVFYGNTNILTETMRDIGIDQRIVLSVIVVLIFMVGIYPEPMFRLVENTSDIILNRIQTK
jgi:NADH-quinone oxidoreductase subunit M